MRSLNRLFVVGGLMLATAGAASAAPTTVLDTLSGNNFAASTGVTLGFDANTASVNALSKVGFAATDFTLSAAGAGSVASVNTDIVILPPVAAGIPTNDSLYGAFIKLPTGFSGTLASQASSLVSFTGGVGQNNAFFQFNTTPSINQSTGRGNGTLQNLSAILTGGAPTLSAGEYLLVIAPTSALSATSTTGVLDFARYVISSGTTNTASAFSTYNRGLFGDTNGGSLNQLTSIRPTFGVNIGVNVAAVPEASTMVSMAFGLVSLGGLALRRRRAVK